MKHLYSKAKGILFFLLSVLLYQHISAQAVPVTGKIIDSVTVEPIVGASVSVQNGTASTLTDGNGMFTLKANPNDQLVISYIGFQSRTVPVSGDLTSITLSPQAKMLNDVVVTALGVRKEIKRIGYAVQQVNGDDIIKARDQNPITGLAGKVAGLSVGPSAEMLRKPTVLLRGNEITLYVVDGIPISSDTWNISPDDIESYSILKGPTAAALYGARAQYGAILITTKKGLKKKGFTVELNSTNSIDKGFLAFPRLQYEYGPGENQLYAFGDGKGGGLNDNDYDVWGPKFEGQLIPQYDGTYDPNQTFTTTYPGGYVWTGHIQPTPWLARGKNNLDRFLRTGFQTTNNIALNATGDNYNLRFSLSHSYQQSIIPNTELNITNFNMYGSYNISKRLKIEGNLNFNRQYTPNYPDVDYGPNSLIYNVAVWTGADWDVDAPDIRGIWQPGKVGTQQVFAEYQRYHNPWFMVEEWTRGHYKSDIYGYISGNYKIDNNLNLTARTQVTTYNLFRNEKMPFSAHPYGREQNMGDYREDRRELFESNTDVLLNYNYDVAHFVNLSGLIGGTARIFDYNSNWTSTNYLVVPGVYSFSNSLNPLQANSFSSQMRVFSAYYSLDATFGRFLTLSTTGRVDKSSAMPNSKPFFYPSASLSTVVSDYVHLPKAISFLKVRGSFANVRSDATQATVGVAPFNTITALGANPSGLSLYDYPLDYGNNYETPYNGPDYSLIPVYSTSKPYNNQTAAYAPTSLYQTNIKTFDRISYEEGFDIRFINNRLGLSATAFQYIDGPRILPNAISTATGYNTYYINALTTKKTGYEVSISGTPIKQKSFTWDVLVNWSTYQDRYKKLPEGQLIYGNYYVTKETQKQIKANAEREGIEDNSGYYNNRVDAFYSSAFVKTADGQIVYDNAGKPLTNPTAQFLGYLNAKYQWSIYNKFSIKGFSFDFQFDGSVGGVTTDYIHNKTMRGGRNIETVQGKLGEARSADNDHAGDPNYPGIYVGDGVVVSNGAAINYNSTTGEILNYDELKFGANSQVVHVQDFVSKYYNVDEANLMSKTFAKLRQVTISYDLPAEWLKKSFISKLSLSLVGRNLIYFYKDKRFKDVDLDQYNYSTSGTSLQTPTMRRYGFNINVTF